MPNAKHAEFATRLTGTTTSKTVGQNGPATIYSTGTTKLQASASVQLDANGITWQTPVAQAQTSTRIDGIAAGRGGMVQNIATQRVYEAKPQAERVAGDHAAGKLRNRLAAEVSQNLAKANKDFQEKFRYPLLRRREFPSLLEFSTTEDALFVKSLQADSRQIAAPTEPPAQADPTAALFVQMHESAANNFAEGVLSGVTIREEDVQAKVIEMRGSLPDELKSDDDREPWSLTFADEQPVILVVSNGGFRITVRGKHFTSGDRHFKAMNVTAIYKVQQEGNGTHLVRQGELQIFPPDFVEGKSSFNMQQTALRSILKKKFGKLFPPETVNEGLELPGKWKLAGKLPLRQLVADHGWLVLGWGMPNERTAASKPTGAAAKGKPSANQQTANDE